MPLTVRTRVFGLVLLSLALAGAQITIMPGDVPQTPGDTFTYKYTVEMSPVDVGTQGGPQTWVFDTSTFVGNITAYKLVDPAGTPLVPYFPLANIASQTEADANTTAYEYLGLNASELTEYGGGSVSPDTMIFQVWDPPMLAFTLPLGYGTQWTSDWGWCDTMEDLIISLHTWGPAYVDAWGTADLPFTSVPCLRINGYDSTITMTWYQGNLINSDTFGIRFYRWYAAHLGLVAAASGVEDDTSLVFTESNCHRTMVAATYGIAEQNELEPAASLCVAPNPFNRTVQVSFAARGRDAGTVRIFDRAGKLVRTLAGDAPADGRRSVAWNGTNETGCRVASGVYFCSASADGATATGKLVLSD